MKDPFEGSQERYAHKALEYEKKGELCKALRCWKIVAAFTPADNEASGKISRLEKIIALRANTHLKKGIYYYREGSMQKAREEFLLCLGYDRENAQALDYLKDKMQEKVFTYYVTKKGDDLQGIAQGMYNDRNVAFVIASFNDLDPHGALRPGVKLSLPVMARSMEEKTIPEGESAKITKTHLDDLMYTAVSFFDNGMYDAAMTTTQKVLDYDITYKDARKFLEHMEQEAEKHYRQGVKFFIEENIKQSIEEWNITLILNPDHEKAKINRKKARDLLKKLEAIQ